MSASERIVRGMMDSVRSRWSIVYMLRDASVRSSHNNPLVN